MSNSIGILCKTGYNLHVKVWKGTVGARPAYTQIETLQLVALWALLQLFSGASLLSGATLYVDANGAAPFPPFIDWLTAATNIQDAVDAASPGDQIIVTNGVYASGGGVFAAGASNRVAIAKAVEVTSVNGPGQTIILGEQGVYPIRCTYITNGAVLSGFTLTNSSIDQNGGGIYAEPSGVVSNCVVSGASGFSGGIFGGKVYDSTITGCAGLYGGGISSCTAFGCVISSNMAGATGGGIYGGAATNCTIVRNHAGNCGGAIFASLDHCTIAANVAAGMGGGAGAYCQLWNCVISGNAVTTPNGQGGGLSSPITATGCLIIGNSAPSQGGGAYFANLTNCVLAWNVCSNSGAGAFNGVLEGCTLSNNYAYGSGGGSWGSTLSHCTIQANIAMGGGGGVYSGTLLSSIVVSNYADSAGGGLESSVANDCSIIANRGTDGAGVWGGNITNCLLAYNRAERVYYPRGGAAYLCTLDHCTIATNFASEGAGVRSSYVYNSVLIGNIGSWGGGAAYSTLDHCAIGANVGYPAGAGDCSLTGCLVTNNIGVGVLGGGIYSCTVAGNVQGAEGGTFVNSIVYGNTDSNWEFDSFYGLHFTSSCTDPIPTNYITTFSSMSAVDTFTNNSVFVNPGAGDYHLQPSSPCINAGRNSFVTSATDFDGLPRISRGTVDLGAYEFSNPPSALSYWWAQNFGIPTDGLADLADADGDGMSNIAEWTAGTSPIDPASVFTMLTPTVGSNSVGLSWRSVTNRTYLVQRAAINPSSPFVAVSPPIPGQPSLTTFADPVNSAQSGWQYRVLVIPP